MQWKKANEAAQYWCGNISPKVLYAAVKAGKLKAARIGAGRNLLFCEGVVRRVVDALREE